MLDTIRISLKVLNAVQLAAVAAAAFALAWFGGALSGARPVAGIERPVLGQAARAFADAVDEELGGSIADARNAALLLRLDDPAVPDAWRAARLRDWLALNPRYRDAVLLAPDGALRAAGADPAQGAGPARRAWFARIRGAEVAVTAGPEGSDVPFEVTLALGPPGRSDRLLLQAAPTYFDGIGARVRRALGRAEEIRFAVAGADGRALVGPLPAAGDPRPHEAAPTRGSRDLASPGWIVTAVAPEVPARPSGPDARLVGLGLALVLAAAALGYVLGGRVSARLRRLADEAAIPGEAASDDAPASRMHEIAVISGSVRDRTRSADALLAGAGTGLDRVRGRLHTFETMSGWTCWEIDPETRQVVWLDRDGAGALAVADRVATLGDLAARFEPADRPLLDLTLAAALAADGPHDVVLHTRGPGPESGRRLLVRLLRGRDADGRLRVNALSREIREGDAADTPAGANERRRNLVLRRVTDGIVHDFNDVLTVVLANLGVLRRQTALDARQAGLTDAALAGAQRGAALTRRLLGLVRGGDGLGKGDLAETDLAATVTAFLPFLQANVLRDAPVVTRIPAGLPKVLCDERILELVLLNLAFHVRDLGLHGFAVGAAEHPADEPRAPGMPAGPCLRILLASGRRLPDAPVPAGAPRAVETAAQLVRECGGGWRLVCDGRGAEAFLAEIWLRAEACIAGDDAAPAEQAPLRILLVESDSLVRASLVEALGELGHAVVQAASGEHALALLARDAAFDAMIADQAMPVMTGLQLAATVVERHPGIRVILASPHGQLPAAARRFLQLDKPFRREDLAAVLGSAASARAA
ncbi:response regulator receiver protein [Methylobacterium variabile]|uniref:histidine kinase n=1 Tax=Methylobacterium variabile TaxID=298794 RepID=A0A0J6T9V6_9HYPH|nr:response regulator [Methylobacterium variabile]KMO42659.1 response regulator receiver protein [Methylobacterium variabile]